MAVAIVVATWLGANPPGFAAQVVALAFGIAAASLFPTLMMGIFSKRINNKGAVAGMLCGLVFTFVVHLRVQGMVLHSGHGQPCRYRRELGIWNLSTVDWCNRCPRQLCGSLRCI